MHRVCVAILLFLVPAALAQPLINEVYPKSPEWLEVWNIGNDTLNLSQWNISDNSTQNPDTITCAAIVNCSPTTNVTYFLILGNATNITAITNESVVYYYVDDTAIGNGLTDSGDALSFYNASYSTNMSYNSSVVGQSWALVNDSWADCSYPTPGFANNCTTGGNESNASSQNVVLSTNLDATVIVDTNYTGIFNISIEGKTNCSSTDNVTVEYNITTNGSLVMNENETVSIGCIGSAGGWSPNATGEYELCGTILNTTANNSNVSDDSVCANVTVIENTDDSWINITSVNQGSDDTSKWGESIDVWIEAYRGDTAQYAVTAYVRYTSSTTKVSEDSVMHILSKYIKYKFKIPIRLKPNCKEDYPDGHYMLVVSGLGENKTSSVRIDGISSSFCQTITSEASSSGGGGGCPITTTNATASTGENTDFYFVSAPDEVVAGEAFDVTVHIQNAAGGASTYAVYSYVFDGNVLLSEGQANGTWQKGWDANARSVIIEAGSDENVTLVNRVKANVTPGTYKLRFRVRDVRDLTKSVKIVERSDSGLRDVESANESSGNTSNVTGVTSNATTVPSQIHNQTQNRTRQLITREDPLDALKRTAGETAQDFVASTSAISGYVVENAPKPDFTAIPRMLGRLLEGFIWAVVQILRS